MVRAMLGATLVWALSGCATMPLTGVQPSGERLGIQNDVITTSHTEKQKVGEVQYKDSYGQSYGSASVYQDVEVREHQEVWYPAQGEQRIDEEDFFRIAGDEAAAKEAREYRETGVLMNRIGLGLLAGGLATVLGGKALNADPIAWAGVITTIPGGLLWWMGERRTKPENHPFETVRVINTANQYNRRLAGMPPPVRSEANPQRLSDEDDRAYLSPAPPLTPVPGRNLKPLPGGKKRSPSLSAKVVE
jgi:hypothetical protein